MKLQLLDNYGKVLESWNTGEVLWQVLEKKHVNEKLSDEQWEEFISAKENHFADSTSEIASELYDYFEQGE